VGHAEWFFVVECFIVYNVQGWSVQVLHRQGPKPNRNWWPPTCCFNGLKKWSVMSCNPSTWQCNLTHCMSVSSISLFGSLNQHFEFTSSSITRKWRRLYVKGWECKSPIATTMKLWILYQDRTSALSLFAELDVILQWSKWATCNIVVIWFLWSAKSYLLNITCGLDCVTLDDCVT